MCFVIYYAEIHTFAQVILRDAELNGTDGRGWKADKTRETKEVILAKIRAFYDSRVNFKANYLVCY